MTKAIQPYGTWSGTINSLSLAGELRLNDAQWDNISNTLVWSERREGRNVLVAQTGADAPRDLTEAGLSARGGIGYGGGEFTVVHGSVYFAANQRLYRQELSGGLARPITPAFGNLASPGVSSDGKWVVFVHSYEEKDSLALTDSNGDIWPRILLADSDFVMQPVWHPAGTHLAAITWNHPQMPWNGTQLRLLTLEYDATGVPFPQFTYTLTGDRDTAIFQPEFSPDGRYLSYISDQSGFGQLYLYDLQNQTHRQLTHEAEHGKPAWIQGLRVYGWTGDSGGIFYQKNEQGLISLWHVELNTHTHTKITDLDQYTDLRQISVSRRENCVATIASSSQIPPRVISYSPQEGIRIHRRSATENISAGALAQARPITWTGHDGETVHGIYTPPHHPEYTDTGKPPLIVSIHGGPTSQKILGYDGEAQFYSSRGFAALQVNYRGSAGYGKAYMNKHKGNFGIYDVEDAISGAQHLINQELADPKKLVIEGGSAGGFTVLQSLVIKPGFYKAGICRYGISNQFLLAMDTHKFESRYTDWLLGELPDAAEIYRERSPIFHAERISDPLILFQGTDDSVVPKNQSDAIAAILRKRGVPHEYHVYEGEGHGWRKPETIADYYEKVMSFLMQYVIYA